MLFNSYQFIFLFLPVAVGLFFLIGRYHHRAAALWLVIASLVFYGKWSRTYVLLLLLSIGFNYLIGLALARWPASQRRRWLLVFGVAANLALLGYYKYAGFFVSNINAAFDLELNLATVVLPLGISFFTFTQIAFLVDTYRREAREYNLIHYCLFVTYFPHLIAGPILHHKEMMPQFALPATYRIKLENVSVGITIFALGLFKKVIIADTLALQVEPVFSATGEPVGFLQAWIGVLAYSFQLYFDFSGYSDMAIGGSRLFGIRLPLNFNSPYQAVNIVDFWRRWHMTLSRFLRDYLYVPLGGNRKGPWRRYVNLMVTMLLGGLWHGAGWTFVIWGGLHGAYLAINHAWHGMRKRSRVLGARVSGFGVIAATSLTFLATTLAWVFFRAESVASAWGIMKSLAGLNGFVVPTQWLPPAVGTLKWFIFGEGSVFVSIAVALCVVFLMPNTQQIMRKFRPALGHDDAAKYRAIAWHPSWRWAAGTAFLFTCAIMSLGKASPFLYFQF